MVQKQPNATDRENTKVAQENSSVQTFKDLSDAPFISPEFLKKYAGEGPQEVHGELSETYTVTVERKS